MPKRDKNEEMRKRLDRIEDALAKSNLPDAVRQLGDKTDFYNFDPTKPAESLSLYQEAERIDSQQGYARRLGQASRLKILHEQIKMAFAGYAGEKAKEAASTAAIEEMPANAPVDEGIERISCRGWYSWIYRTKETRRLDEEFAANLRLNGYIYLATSPLMKVFKDIAEIKRYFAAVSLRDLMEDTKSYIPASDLEQHIMNGFIALKKCQEDEAVIAVPLKLQ